MPIKSYFFNAMKDGDTYDRVYSAQDMTDYLDGIVGNGIFPNPSTNLQVIATTGMQVNVKAGMGWIEGHKMVNTADLIVDIDAADVVLGRIDRVVFFVDYSTREMGIKVKKGTNAISPVAPDIVRDTNMIEYGLALINIPKQTTEITPTMITDTRLDDSVCGVVAGLIKQVGTETLFIQYQQAFKEDREQRNDEFDTWFQNIKEELSTSTLLRTFKSLYVTKVQDESEILINIPQFSTTLDILEVYVNGFRLDSTMYTLEGEDRVVLTKPVDAGTSIEFVIYKSMDGAEAETVVEEVEKIQTDVAELKKTSVKGEHAVTLTTDAWTQEGEYFYQNTTVEGITATSSLIVSPAPVSIENYGSVIAVEQSANTLKFRSKEQPSVDLSVQIMNLGG